MRIGPYDVHAIEAGCFALDGGAMFGIVPKAIWNRLNPADELNRIELRLRCLLLIERDTDGTRKRVLLVDNGIGTKWTEKFASIYKIDHSQWSLDQELARHGIRLEDVTDLIATHMHFDHMGGTTRHVNGKLEATFPNARLWVQEQNWKAAYHPNERDRASYLTENYDVYRNSPQLNLLQTSYGSREEILPNIFARISNGHTPGLQLIEIADDDRALLYCADAVPTASHVKVPYTMGYDCAPLTMMAEKRKLLSEAVDRDMMLFFEHCPRMHAATIFHDGKDFAVKESLQF